MFYSKNLPAWERGLRILIGFTALLFAVFNWGSSGIAVVAGLTGSILALSGLFGFCPMCALVGRRINKNTPE